MNAPFRTPELDLPRHKFSTQDVFKMLEAGILSWDEKIELIYGELVVLSPKNNQHELVKSALNLLLARAVPDGVRLGTETTLYLEPQLFVEPDLMLCPKAILPEDVRGEDVLLAIEVSGSTLRRDLGEKAAIYALHGVRDYWAVDAAKKRIIVHRKPSDDGYGSIETYEGDAPVEALLVPGISVRPSLDLD